MLRTIIGLLVTFFIFRLLWKLTGLLTSSLPKKQVKPKPTKIQKPILKGGEYISYEEVKE